MRRQDEISIARRSLDPPRRPLRVQGSKNVGLHLWAAAIGSGRPVKLTRIPRIPDFDVVESIATQCGAQRISSGEFDFSTVRSGYISNDLGGRIRPTVCFAASLAELLGHASCPLPGGDSFTKRPVGLHISVLRSAGFEVVETADSRIELKRARKASSFRCSVLGEFGPSLGATVTGAILAAFRPGRSEIASPSMEPEVLFTLEFLACFGVTWEYNQQADTMYVFGTERDSARVVYENQPDRIALGTWILWSAVAGVPLSFERCSFSILPTGALRTFDAIGITLSEGAPGAVANPPNILQSGNFRTGVHPGFPTDLQPQLCAALGFSAGKSSVAESIYAARNTHVPVLEALGIEISPRANGSLDIAGDPDLVLPAFTSVAVRDIRAGAAAIVASARGGRIRISGVYHLDRGYEHLDSTLEGLGYVVERA